MSTRTPTMEKKCMGTVNTLSLGKFISTAKPKQSTTRSEKTTWAAQRSQQFRGVSYWHVRGRITSWLQRRLCFPDSYFEHPVLYFINWLLDEVLILNKRCVSIKQWTQSPAFLRHHVCTGGWNQKKYLVFPFYGRVLQFYQVLTISTTSEKGW